ncbi:MAG: bifunctional 5,10-methylenetetrahydrofolate dehydrogenase/5,10-methenyltetrahydrofolate cyclohydrolase, partial [Elusimicrobia bacterium]|nr:bifunctional 5,10-methylenetetrahydrofolate dehydrogenase/5,10-methenyltetrahydrofolate cyclohydrolase [Elusimicrobiota bacterium]
MSAALLDGKTAAARVYERVQSKAKELSARGITPGLATVLVGEDPASAVYVGQKIKSCKANGLKSIHVPLPASVSEAALIGKVQELNQDPAVHGIIVQLPLPKHFRAEHVLSVLDPKKDADGLHPSNQGQWMQLKSWKDVLSSGIPLPCTPAGVMELLEQNGVALSGAAAVVLGRSQLVGKPLAFLLLAADATVSLCHSRTRDMAQMCRRADVLVAAIGVPRFVKADMVKRGAVVIDVGVNRLPTGLAGDVDFENVKEVAGAITPVPGGVGKMTVAMLLWNTVRAAEKS